MNASDTNEHPEPLPEEAKASLARAGERLLGQLETLRAEGEAAEEIDALDPDASLALRKHGDGLLDELAAKRKVANGSGASWWTLGRQWMAAAAVVIVFGIVANQLHHQPAKVALQTSGASESTSAQDDGTNPGILAVGQAVPEPGTGVLTLIGGVMLVLRRQRR